MPPADSGHTPGGTPRRTWSAGTLTYTTAGLVVLFCWLLWGDFAWALKDRAIPPIVQTLLKKFGASDMTAGLLFGSLPPALGLILGPVIAYKSDRYRSRLGRRIPFLLVSTPVAVLGIVGMAFSPAVGVQLDKWLGPHSCGPDACVLLLLGLCWMFFEFATVIANGLFGALINDVVPLAVMGRFYGLFRALSLIAAMIFFHWGYVMVDTAYVWIFLGMGTLYGVGFMSMCLTVKEGEYPPPPPAEKRSLKGIILGIRTYFEECFGHAYYWWYFLALAIAGLATGPVNLYSIFYSNSIHMSAGTYGDCLVLTYAVSLILAWPLGWLADRVHPLRIGIVVLILYAIVTLWGGIFAVDSRTFAIALVAHGIVAGTWSTTTASLGQRMLPKAEFAQFASAGGILANVFWIMLAPLSGYLLDHLHHDYRYTFFMGFTLAILGLIGCVIVHGKFMAHGGPKNYLAPR
jgi:MFS family permease